jgi:hypothetical protein
MAAPQNGISLSMLSFGFGREKFVCSAELPASPFFTRFTSGIPVAGSSGGRGT